PPAPLRTPTNPEIAGRVGSARECAGDRDVEWHILVQAVVPADDREAAASGLAERFGGVMSAAEILASPFVLLGTVAEMADQVLRNRERWGFSYYTVHGPFREAFAPVIERLRP